MYKIIILIILSLYSLSMNAVVIEKESRIQITSIENQYAKKVGQIEVWNNDNPQKRSACTATNLNKKYIITSAHCIINQITNSPYDNVVYYPRRLNMEERFPSRVYIKIGYLMKGYEVSGEELNNMEITLDRAITSSMVTQDLAILEAYSDMENSYVGDEYGYYRHDSINLKNNEEIRVNASSYASDKEFSTLWHEECKVKGTITNIATIDCDLVSGGSGTSLIYQNKIIGVFSAEDPDLEKNYVTLITKEMEKEINNIIIGEHFANKMLKKVEFNTELNNYIYVENKCQNSIKAVILVQQEGEKRFYLFHKIEPKKISKKVLSNENIEYYYYAESLNKKYVWEGEDIFGYILEGEEAKGLIKAKKTNYRTGESYGDWYVSLKCY